MEGKLPKFLMVLAHEGVKPNPYPLGVQKLLKEKMVKFWPVNFHGVQKLDLGVPSHM
jgi:hypothetical protein